MPELPEVESLVRDLGPGVIGRTIERVEVHKPKLLSAARGLTLEDLCGRRFERVWRRGKLAVWELSGDLSLVVHLKLAGQMVHVAADGHELAHGGHPVPMWGTPLPHKSSHVVFHFDDASTLYLTDIRQFARLTLLPDREVAGFLKKQKLGPEPLTRRFNAEEFFRRLQRRGIPLKTAIMDQSVVGGIGNIYADESLWRARLHGGRATETLTGRRAHTLLGHVRDVLTEALGQGGTSFDSLYVDVNGESGYFDRSLAVYGREGEPCPRCGTPIRREPFMNRSSYSCPRCQPRPRAVR